MLLAWQSLERAKKSPPMLLLLRLRSPREAPRIGQQRLSHTHTDAHIHHARAHPKRSSGVSTQVLAECTPALAGEGRKNQSLLVPNVLERAEERRSTLRELAESRTGRGETEASGSPHRLAKGKQRSTPAWTWVRRAPARRSRPTRSAGTSRAQERRGCRATNLVVPGRAVLERPHRWRGEHRDCRNIMFPKHNVPRRKTVHARGDQNGAVSECIIGTGRTH